MEQRIGSGSQPLEGAGFDPAFVPGLTSPPSARPEDVKKAGAAEETAPEETVPEDTSSKDTASGTADEPETEVTDEPGAEADKDADDGADADLGGPVFEAADRRARIVADRSGVQLFLDDQECEFRWDEIGAIETETSRFGRLFTVTVHTPDRRWYPIEIEATAKNSFDEWEEQLDAVLDAYFDDEDPEDWGDEDDIEDADVDIEDADGADTDDAGAKKSDARRSRVRRPRAK